VVDIGVYNMAIEVTIPSEQLPPKVRIWQININNGIDHPIPIAESTPDTYTNVQVPILDSNGNPTYEVIQTPTLDENGNTVLDQDGNPTYTETQGAQLFTVERVCVPGVITGYHAEFDEFPKVELVIRGVWPLLHPTTGDQITNPAGQPAYINSPYVANIILTLSELVEYMSLWEHMATISYAKIQEKSNTNSITWRKL
jgi:hypothetical protein